MASGTGEQYVRKFATLNDEEVVGTGQRSGSFFFITFSPGTVGGTLFANKCNLELTVFKREIIYQNMGTVRESVISGNEF